LYDLAGFIEPVRLIPSEFNHVDYFTTKFDAGSRQASLLIGAAMQQILLRRGDLGRERNLTKPVKSADHAILSFAT
jgi:hypothetical protein